MGNRKVLSKGKLLIIIIAALLLLMAMLGLFSPKFAVQAHASTLDELIQDDLQINEYTQPLTDIVKEDGNLGWEPMIYAAQQAEHQALASASMNLGQAYSTTTTTSTAPNGELRTMHTATQTTNQIIVYIVADRYTDTQQETFFTAAQNIANHIVGLHPVSEYKAWIFLGF